LDPDPVAYHITSSLAAELGRPIDLHTDEALNPSVLHLPHLDLVAETGFSNRATASHCVSLVSNRSRSRQKSPNGSPPRGSP